MSNAKKCDRCGKLYEIYDGFSIIEGGNKYCKLSFLNYWSVKSKDYDLCPECMKSLFEWLKEVEND